VTDCLKTITELLSATSGFAWPIVIVGLVIWFHKAIIGIFNAITLQIQMGASVKYGDLELTGKKIDAFPLTNGTGYERIAASREMLEERDITYKKQKNIFLVHRAKVTASRHEPTGLAYYDLSIYLVTHKNYGALNEIKQVEYYLGKYFGRSVSPNGTTYIVKNSNDGFAIRTTAYGPTLCEAKIAFHDGTMAIMNRYLDFEGTGYHFDPNVNAHDAGLTK
jgi:hypothetical protein